MFKSMVLYGLSALMFVAGGANAAQNCATYSVAPGDTLRLISEQYYGQRDLSPIIYAANAAVVGPNPNTIEIGMTLEIPCRDGMTIAEPTAFLALIGPETPTGLAPRFAAKAGRSPFMARDNSGILPDILSAALRAGGFEGALDIARPETTSDVLRTSTQPAALLAFPWVRPSCETPETLSPQSAYLCQNYSFSAPLYEITLGVFTTSNSPLALAHGAAAFTGTTICVPQFHTDDLLRNNGISAVSTLVSAPDFQSCLTGVMRGDYDAFVADYQSFGAFSPNTDGLTDIPAFAQTSTLHAMAYTQNPAAMQVLGMANTGLKQILASGEWFRIVNRHLPQMSN